MKLAENSRELVSIDGPDGGMTIPFLKDILRQAKLYVRPLQMDITVKEAKKLCRFAKAAKNQFAKAKNLSFAKVFNPLVKTYSSTSLPQCYRWSLRRMRSALGRYNIIIQPSTKNNTNCG